VSNAAAETALGPMVIVAAEQHEPSPLIHDPWAQRLLPLSGRIAAGISRWSPARRALISATERKLRGGWASFLCRKRYIDDQLVGAVAKGIDAVVILGAGYPDEYEARYLRPAGRTLTASEIERAVYAER
jgi:methyltransferase (TIGR00027 family)